MEERGWMKIGTANHGTWGLWRRADPHGETFFTAMIAPLIPHHLNGRVSLETMLAMRGLIQDA